MPAIAQLLTATLIGLGLAVLIIGRFPMFRNDFRRSVSIAVTAVSLVTILLSLNVLVSAIHLQQSIGDDHLSMVNGMLLAGLALMLVSALAFFFSLSVLVWTLVPPKPKQISVFALEPVPAQTTPVDPYTT